MNKKPLSLLLMVPCLAAAQMLRGPTVAESDAFERSLMEKVPVFAGRSMAALATDSTYLYQTQHFVVAYRTSGVHAVAGASVDADKDGVPDNIQAIGKIAERVWRLGVDTLKYKAPPGRDSITGYQFRTKTGKFPIVVCDMPTFTTPWAGKAYMGYTVRPLVDPDSLGGGQLVVENDFLDGGAAIKAKVGPENSANGVDSLLYDYSKEPVKGWSTTIAHEFYHALQYQYDQSYRYAWHEMTATWFAKRAYPEVKHHWQYLGAFIKANYDGPFETWDAMAPYYNYPFVSIVVGEFGDTVLKALWGDHRDSFQIDEDHWFGKALVRLRLTEYSLLKNYAKEYLRLTENVPGILNDNGAWVNSRNTMIGDDFNPRRLVAAGGNICNGAHLYGNMYCIVDSAQFKNSNILISANAASSSAAIGLIRLPSRRVESYTASKDSVVIGAYPNDTEWRFVLISGFIGSAGGGAIPSLDATSKPAAGVHRALHSTAPRTVVNRFDLHGRPVTSATRGVILEGSPETGWHRRVKLLEQ